MFGVLFLKSRSSLRGRSSARNFFIGAGRSSMLLSLVIMSLVPAVSGHAAPVRLAGHVPSGLAGLLPTGRLKKDQQLSLSLGLPLRNAPALTNLLQELYNPASPRFGHYLTAEGFAEQFGPEQNDYDALMYFAKSNGLAVAGTHPNRMLLNLNASVGDIERVFHVTLREYQHPRENRTFFAPDTEPEVDAPIPILHIGGLNNFMRARPLSHIKPGGATGSYLLAGTGSGPSGSFWGHDLRVAYAPGVQLTGAGQIVALLQFDGYYASDIARYASQAGVAQVPLQNVLLDGFNGRPGSDNDEVALDIEMCMAMAPGLAKIMIYEAGPNGSGDDVLNRMATDNQARQISSSWSFDTTPTTSQIFQQFAAQGQSFFNASGDSDAYATTDTIYAPCDNPYITVVGGTTLTTAGQGGAYVSEKVWNWGGGQGSGGGVTSWSIPVWQQGVDMSRNLGSATRRNIPDVAMAAENVAVMSSNGKVSVMGGTSCASPLWAAFAALANQQAVESGGPSLGFLNPALYRLAETSDYASYFHDVTAGNNAGPGTGQQFYAAPGYDLCTGWGSPKGQTLIDALVPPALTVVKPAAAPIIVDVHYTAGTMNFAFMAEAGHTYTVETKESYSSNQWAPLQSFTGAGAMQQVADSAPAAQRLYRVVVTN